MQKRLALFTPILAGLSIFFSQPVLAHVIWFDQQSNNYELIFGHPELNSPEPLILSKFKEANAYDANKNPIPLTTNFIGGQLFVTPESQASALTAFYDNGYWLRNPDGSSTNITQEEAEAINYQNTSNFVKYTKYLAEWSDVLAEPFGLPLEIIALENPLGLQSGDQLPIQVLFQGDVILNPIVEYLGQTLSIDANGVVLIPIGQGGLEVIEASYQVPDLINPAVSYATTLSVQATSVPEPSFILGLGVLGFSFLARKIQKEKS